ncbi:MAG: DNA-processing protein DprA [Breznakia sp.]
MLGFFSLNYYIILMKSKRKQILAYAMKYNGEYHKIKKAIQQQEPYEEFIYHGNYICIEDEDYPKELYELQNPPFILFYKGDIRILKREGITVIGTRNMSDVGKAYCDLVNIHLPSHYAIISGLAMGVDGYIHTCALKKRKTIAVIGCGIDYIYPYAHKDLYKEIAEKHLLLSEYPAVTKPFAHHFPWRNRLLAALSQALIIIEAKQKSGTMLTVNYALTLNREIYCFPHNLMNKTGGGCNALIREGANVFVDAEDIADL